MIKSKSLLLAATILVAGIANLFSASFETDDSFVPPRWGQAGIFTNAVATVGVTNSTRGSNPIKVHPGVLVLQASCVATQASTSNLVFKLSTSLDGRVWATAFLSSPSATLTGTTTNTVNLIIGTNLQYRYVSIDAFTSTELATSFVGPVSYAFLAAQSQSPSPGITQ